MHTGHTFQLTAQTLEEKTITHTGHMFQLTAQTVMKMTYRPHLAAYLTSCLQVTFQLTAQTLGDKTHIH